MWYLAHTREYKFISCKSYEHAVNEYYRQYRDADGSIPWIIEYKEQDPQLNWLEQLTFNQLVPGSSPGGFTIHYGV